MEHLDAELLSLMALGETQGTEADAIHLAGCPECADTLRGFQRVAEIATLEPAAITLDRPGPGTWTAIHQALGLSPELAADPLDRPGLQVIRPAAVETAAKQGNRMDPAAAPERSNSGGAAAHSRRRPRARAAAAAAAGIVLGTAAGWTAAGVLGQGRPPSPGPTQSAAPARVLAEAPLAPLAAHTSSGQAQVEQLADGSRQLTVRLSTEGTGGYQQVWVATSDLSGMVSLGVLSEGTGTFTLPAGIDLAQYSVVDVSAQAYNGNPAHSDNSVARGTLSPTS